MQYAGFNPWGKVFSAGQKIAQPAQKTTAPPDEFPLTKNKKTTKKTPCHKPFGQHSGFAIPGLFPEWHCTC